MDLTPSSPAIQNSINNMERASGIGRIGVRVTCHGKMGSTFDNLPSTFFRSELSLRPHITGSVNRL